MKNSDLSNDEILHLKRVQGKSTIDLMTDFPERRESVGEVALMDLPSEVLKELIVEHDLLKKVLELKRKHI